MLFWSFVKWEANIYLAKLWPGLNFSIWLQMPEYKEDLCAPYTNFFDSFASSKIKSSCELCLSNSYAYFKKLNSHNLEDMICRQSRL